MRMIVTRIQTDTQTHTHTHTHKETDEAMATSEITDLPNKAYSAMCAVENLLALM